jgi:hypothetical protein
MTLFIITCENFLKQMRRARKLLIFYSNTEFIILNSTKSLPPLYFSGGNTLLDY